jgi:hypothetical protein
VVVGNAAYVGVQARPRLHVWCSMTGPAWSSCAWHGIVC